MMANDLELAFLKEYTGMDGTINDLRLAYFKMVVDNPPVSSTELADLDARVTALENPA